MDQQENRKATLARSVRSGFQVHDLDVPLTAADWTQLSEEEAPLSVRTLTELWAERTMDPWHILIESVASLTPSILNDVSDQSVLAPLRSLLVRAEQAAVVFGHPFNWTSPDQWGYLLHVRHTRRADTYAPMLLHPPARQEDLTRAEHVLAASLPPS